MRCSARIICHVSDPSFRPREVPIPHPDDKCGVTPTSVRRPHRLSRPKRLFPDSVAIRAPILTEQNPAEMIGETVIDCRPSLLPVSIPLSGLSPETISGARHCVSYIPSEETGQSIMNMDTSEITINHKELTTNTKESVKNFTN